MGDNVHLVNDPKNRLWVPLLLLLGCGSPLAADALPVVDQRLEVRLRPEGMTVDAQIDLPESLSGSVVEFLLGRAFEPEAVGGEILSRTPFGDGALYRYRIRVNNGNGTLRLRYGGTPATERTLPRRAMPRVVYDAEGVYLDARSGWYPQLDVAGMTFDLTVRHPKAWRVISQGALTETSPGHSRWRTRVPQDELYLIAGRYHRYHRPGKVATAEVYLLEADESLAKRYLGITERYLDLFSRLLGPYPFAKFAAVENRWETGFGMPSFTLLGRRVMRLPFILTSSYPHEIVHNWLGNSIYPDYASGNWSEGLTTYLADHLIQEQRGDGARYRRRILQKYADYVSSERDFPLRRFRSRHDGATQAVGYGKTMMLFHMLRQRLGGRSFREALRELTARYRFRTAGFDDIRRLFEEVGHQPLKPFFDQWVERVGAPALSITGLSVKQTGEGRYRIEGVLHQTQKNAAYRLEVPLVVTSAGDDRAVIHWISMGGKEQRFSVASESPPLRLDVDPRFDLFRLLNTEELPPSLGQLFGARSLHVVLPSGVDKDRLEGYRALAEGWRRRFPQLMIHSDEEPLPAEGGVWILGGENRHADEVIARLAERYGIQDPRRSPLPDEAAGSVRRGRSVIVTVRRADDSTLGLLLPQSTAALAALGRKLPHYGRFSYLTFIGDAASNELKGEWPVNHSPLTRFLTPDRRVPMGTLPAETPLIR
ncbi:MAG: M1 family aminopeptidase [Gammaproteobacteria bacterium]